MTTRVAFLQRPTTTEHLKGTDIETKRNELVDGGSDATSSAWWTEERSLL